MIDEIRTRIGEGLFEFSKHTVDQSILRRISIQELREAIVGGEIIEDYPNDKYGPSCLIFGFDDEQQTLARSVQLSVAPGVEDYYALRTRCEFVG